jgi:endonuclease YncB( thermonuclease family)
MRVAAVFSLLLRGLGLYKIPLPFRLALIILPLLAALFFAEFVVLKGGIVISVTDGDSLVFLSRSGQTLKVRLYGVDAPEYDQPGGAEAKKFVSKLVLFEHVDLREFDEDRYGRVVALVSLEDGRTLNEELVRAGHSWVYTAYCRSSFCPRWRILEREARQSKIGLWKGQKPVYPEKWRRHDFK